MPTSMVRKWLSKGTTLTKNQWNELASHNKVFRMVLEEQGDSTLGWMQCWLKKHFRRVWNEWLLVGGLALGADRRVPPGACVVKHLYLHLRGKWWTYPSKSVGYPKLRGKAIEQREKSWEGHSNEWIAIRLKLKRLM